MSELTQDGGERQAGLSRVHAERPMGSCTLMVCQRQRPLASTLRLISAPCVGGKKDLEITCDRHTLSNICCLYSVYIRLLMAASGYLSTTCPSLTHSISVPSQPRGSICGKVMVVLSSPPKEKGSSWCQTLLPTLVSGFEAACLKHPLREAKEPKKASASHTRWSSFPWLQTPE